MQKVHLAHKAIKQQLQKQTIWSLLFILFEAVTVAVSLIDIISDVAVCFDFYSRGATRWFVFSLISLLSANAVYALAGLETAPKFVNAIHNKHIMCPKWIRTRLPEVDTYGRKFMKRPLSIEGVLFAVLFPFAQAIPLMHYIAESCLPQPGKTKRGTTAFFEENAVDASHCAGTLQVWNIVQKDYCASTSLERRLAGGLHQHLQTHVLMYLETVVESIPQTVIQLLAISTMSATEEVSTIQIVSLSLSIFSIATKGYVISRGFHLRLTAFRSLLIMFDVFAYFYTCSTLLSASSGRSRLSFFSRCACVCLEQSLDIQASDIHFARICLRCGVGRSHCDEFLQAGPVDVAAALGEHSVD